MKVTLINHSDSLGGASTVTFRLMHALREAGVDARMLVTHKATDSPYVHVAASRRRARIPFLAEHLRIWLHCRLARKNLFQVSIATDGLPLSQHPLVREADFVVLNWVNQGMLSLTEIRKIAQTKPTVWTMHDMWNLTGICHHAGDCDRFLTHCHACPMLGAGAGKHDAAAHTFDAKMALYDSAPIHFVAVSNWLADAARRSALLRGRDISVINNPYSVENVEPSAVTRSELGLPTDGRIILFCAARIDDPMKNLPDAIDALNTLTDTDAVAVFVGSCKNPQALDGLHLPYRNLGPIYDRQRLAAIFSHASVVMSSSAFESFGATLLEGQAAGATPVAPIHDGRADIITDGLTGYAAGPDIRSLGAALRLALERPIAAADLRAAAARFSYPAIAERYIALFSSLTKA